MILAFRLVAIVVGVAIFLWAEYTDTQVNPKTPYATGTRRTDTFYADAMVFSLRILGMGIVFIALVSWVIGNHLKHAAP